MHCSSSTTAAKMAAPLQSLEVIVAGFLLSYRAEEKLIFTSDSCRFITVSSQLRVFWDQQCDTAVVSDLM